MIVGILKEIKIEENRVCMTPAGVEVMRGRGHEVLVETDAGVGSGFGNDAYLDAGAEIVASAEEIYARADMVMHVKEPQPSEYPLIRTGQIVFTYFHFAASEQLTRAFMETGAVAVAYETIVGKDNSLPLLTPMSEVAGRMAAQQAAKYVERAQGGRGILLGGVPGVQPATVLVIGGGVVGTHAAQMACGLGAKVYLLDTSLERLRHLSEVMPKNCFPMMSSPAVIRELAREADVVIGAVLVHGAKAPKLITREMLATMKRGAVLVDVAIDQGGCFETSRPTTHTEPTFVVDGVLHYCVANMPGAVPLTSTVALTNATLPYAVEIADKGWHQAARDNDGIRAGLNIVAGQVVYQGVAEAFGIDCLPVEELISTDVARACA
ncbi:alanine dehydrogenase [Geothermobacter hydrogeniphilus]|uniref:Alanine dehydrogenase n=1 Tax=Geothermobacter hydrogeniphilus TaxID=1969733 RepID=A0A1X0XW65_9BACT|nr:alanine dehydrogenase [Geothermobacter hydrogeniphilus]ORJ57127.1 alanine dehydrogenase [Geothermobacter hydrogeniphilus]